MATGMPWTAKVSDIITNGQWQFPPSSSELQATWDSIRFLPCPSSQDVCTWKGHQSGEFSIASAWELLCDVRPVTRIHHLLWFRGHIPRHSFIIWLACRGRLRTMDRLHSVGILTNNTCILCGIQCGILWALILWCNLSGTVWRAINTKANLHWPCIPWQQLLHWVAMTCQQRNNIISMIARLLLSTSVYILWHKRNNRIFSNRYKTTQAIVEEIF